MELIKKELEAQYLFNLCHDFKTPLSTIMGMTSLSLSELEDSERVKEHLGKIEIASDYLLSMINDILDYSAIMGGRIAIRNEVFSLANAVNSLKQLLTPHFSSKRQSFEVKLEGCSHDELIGDSLRFKQILMNLLTNSMKYTAVGGMIVLEITQSPKSDETLILDMKVKDNGIGMSEEFMKCMFEPYSRAQRNAGTNRESTGLGLYITDNLVKLMDGEISVSSRLMAGTVFTVSIPFKIQGKRKESCIKQAEYRRIDIPKEFAPQNYNFDGKSILIAEDNEDMLELTSELLRPSGIHILSAKNGLEALECFLSSQKGQIHGILMDFSMPEMNGPEAIKKIRQSNHPDSGIIPIFAFTASDDFQEWQKVSEYGIKAFVRKPVDYPHLFKLLDHYINHINGKKNPIV